MSAATASGVVAPLRSAGIDRARGLAILLMIGDHLALFAGFELYRVTLGRVAMPLFFILSGYLVKRLSWRTYAIGWVGLTLPVFVAWVDSPNVLLWYAMGALLVCGLRRYPLALVVFVVVALGAAANGYLHLWGTSYNPVALLALMCVGQLLRWSSLVDPFAVAAVLPRWLGVMGRYPLTWYLGHVLALDFALWTVQRA